MPQITILDAHTTNPGDLSWVPLEQLGELTVYDRTPDEEIVERARGADILLTNKTPLDAETIGELDDLEFISVLATGFDVVDLEAAAERDIPVANVPEYGTESVAEHAIALLLELTRDVGLHDRAVGAGEWEDCPDFTFWKRPLVELEGKTMGIVGFGRIGRRVGRVASAFGMEVLASTGSSEPEVDFGPVDYVENADIFERADVVSLHAPLTDETDGLVDRAMLERMKPSAYLINTARGEMVDEPALREALEADEIAGAAVDVVSEEPMAPDNPLKGAPNCLITPHLAWTSQEARERLIAATAGNVEGYLEGELQNVVNLS